MTQKELSELSGISLRTVQRLELGEVSNPPLRYLVNLAIVLEVDLDAIFEDEWLAWEVFDQRAPAPEQRNLGAKAHDRQRG